MRHLLIPVLLATGLAASHAATASASRACGNAAPKNINGFAKGIRATDVGCKTARQVARRCIRALDRTDLSDEPTVGFNVGSTGWFCSPNKRLKVLAVASDNHPGKVTFNLYYGD